ncbi:hypothetical protein V6x_01590 [Gimesia chilikensis]|uniref:Uncharacterized protein n=1 Tax=Gimesia chilikensis TaxID=2605989 RepID=A0A517W5F0_9PLAN|nr:hypothetical protein V6x_01590 [Gimesia chilikensis]
MQGRRKAESSLIVPDDKPWVQNECRQGNPFRRTKKAMPPGGASPMCCSKTASGTGLTLLGFQIKVQGIFSLFDLSSQLGIFIKFVRHLIFCVIG